MLEKLIESGFAELGIALDAQAAERYRSYFTNLEETNKVMNLTAISGEEDVARLHFLDCAAILRFFELDGKSLIDVGTGAGFPGLALKVACPGLKLTLLDSLDKRINFLRDTCAKLGFEDVNCLHARAEETAAEMREGFDFAASRAVARLNILCELCLPFVKVGGYFVAMKGPDSAQELEEVKKAIGILGGKLEGVKEYAIPGADVSHCLVVVKKVRPSGTKYPRRWAQIKKQPL